jgi:hypothetical protein
VTAAEPADSRTLAVSLHGLPAGSRAPGRLAVQAMRLDDGTVTVGPAAEASGGGVAEATFEAPATRLLVSATLVAAGPGGRGAAWRGEAVAGPSDEAVVLQAAAAGANAPVPTAGPLTRGLTMRPPKRGKAIGYNEFEFKASGEHLGGLGRSLAQFMVVDLVSGPCTQGIGDDAVKVVESANPAKLAAIEAELRFRQSPGCDPAYRTQPQLIAPTHMANGSVVEADGQVTASFQITDLQGRVVAAGSGTGPATDWPAVMSGALARLNADLCGEEGWSGTVTYEEHVALKVPNARPGKPGATVKGDTSFTATFTGNSVSGKASYSNELRGAEGSATTSGAGAADAMVTVSEAEGRVVVEIGLFTLRCATSASFGGGGTSGEEAVQLGGWRGEGPGRPGAASQSGSWSERFDGGKRTMTWSLTRKRPRR